jgi:hypothetical protein
MLDATYAVEGDALVAQIDSLMEPPKTVRYMRKV